MNSFFVFGDDLMRAQVEDRLREAEHDRLVALATGPGRPIRARVAGWLFALAQRIPHPRFARPLPEGEV
ncbi:MAG: hypothetical protein JO057_02095 [Chloroflexi bacterium]|nr:hypothetical protein [Chloroflexota bacterium]